MTGRPHEGVNSVVMHDIREIETWVLRLLSAPVPVPGKTSVRVSNEIFSNKTKKEYNVFITI